MKDTLIILYIIYINVVMDRKAVRPYNANNMRRETSKLPSLNLYKPILYNVSLKCCKS